MLARPACLFILKIAPVVQKARVTKPKLVVVIVTFVGRSGLALGKRMPRINIMPKTTPNSVILSAKFIPQLVPLRNIHYFHKIFNVRSIFVVCLNFNNFYAKVGWL